MIYKRNDHLYHKMNTNVALNSKLDQIIFIYRKKKFSTPFYMQTKKGAQSQKVSDRTSIRLERRTKKTETQHNEIISFTLKHYVRPFFQIEFLWAVVKCSVGGLSKSRQSLIIK